MRKFWSAYLLGCSRKIKVEISLLHGHFPMRLIQVSLKIQILGFYIKAKPCPPHDKVLTIFAIFRLKTQITGISVCMKKLICFIYIVQNMKGCKYKYKY